jgi:hypothetical protein
LGARERFEASVCPESSDERPLTLQPLAELDRGTRNAVSKICQATGVTLHELDAADAKPDDAKGKQHDINAAIERAPISGECG